MQKEYLVNKRNEITLNITDGKVDSFREKDETQCTVRVYEDGKIGVAGALGEADFAELENQATAKLADGIPYPCKLNKNVKKSVLRKKAVVEEGDLMRVAKRLAKKVSAACPKFLVNGKVSSIRSSGWYKNSENTDLEYSNADLQLFFQVKDKNSSNIVDAYYGASVGSFGAVTERKAVEDMRMLHDAFFGEKATLPNGKYPVIIGAADILQHIVKDVVAEYYVSGGSLFSGKLGEKIFNEKFSAYADNNPVTNRTSAFYDSEGEISPAFRSAIVEKGVFKRVLTTKNTSSMFGLPLSKTSSAPYDGVPSLGWSGFYMDGTAPDLKTLLGDKKAVYISITSGGDITNEGVVGLPVQLAFLVENGKIVARLTDFSASGNIKDILGKDFIGVSEKDIFEATQEKLLVTEMEIING